jgi:HAD superfamily hydrolase (TIGR01549 family)
VRVSTDLTIKAVIMDFGGTLAEGHIDWSEFHMAVHGYLKGLGYSYSFREISRGMSSALDRLNNVRHRGDELTFEENYDYFLGKMGVPSSPETLTDLHDIFKVHYKSTFYHCIPEVLIRLSGGYKLAILSNTMSDQPREMIVDAGYSDYFEMVVCSRDLGIRKPNPEIFRYMLRNLGVMASETVHVGDSVEADMDGADSVGITGVWIRTQDQPPWHGYSINSICDLPVFLGNL